MSESNSVCIHKLEEIRTPLDQILASFSADSLVQYKSISKFWYDLICSPEFVRLQQRCSREDMIYIVCPYPGSRDGFRDVYLLDRDGDIIKTITLPPLFHRLSIWLISSFNGSPSIETPTVGVAFNAGSGNYKIFRYFKDILKSEDGHYNCEVCSSVTGSWKGIGSVDCRPTMNANCQASSGHICVGGRKYWFSRSKRLPGVLNGVRSVDMEEEKFKQISLPQNVLVTDRSCLIDLDGHLSLVTLELTVDFVCIDYFIEHTHIDIWVLEDLEQSKWCHKISTKHPRKEIVSLESVVAIKHDILFIVMDSDMEVHKDVYDMDEDNWRVLDVLPSAHWYRPVAFPFSGSLGSCRGI